MRSNVVFGRCVAVFVLAVVSACGSGAKIESQKAQAPGAELTEVVKGGAAGTEAVPAGAQGGSERVKLVSSDIAQYFQSIDADPTQPFPVDVSDFYLSEDSLITPKDLEILEWSLHEEEALLSSDGKVVVKGFSAKLKLGNASSCGQLSVDHLMMIFCPGSIEVSIGEDPTKKSQAVLAVVEAAGKDADAPPKIRVMEVDVTAPVLRDSAVLGTIISTLAQNRHEQQQGEASGEASGGEVGAPAADTSQPAGLTLATLIDQLLSKAGPGTQAAGVAGSGFSELRNKISTKATAVSAVLGGASVPGGSITELSVTNLVLQSTHPLPGLADLWFPNIMSGLVLPQGRILLTLNSGGVDGSQTRHPFSSKLMMLNTSSVTLTETPMPISEFGLSADDEYFQPWVVVQAGPSKIAVLGFLNYRGSAGTIETTNVLVTYDLNVATGSLSNRREVGRFTDAALTGLESRNTATYTGVLYDAWTPAMVCNGLSCHIVSQASAYHTYTGPTVFVASVDLGSGQISTPRGLSLSDKRLSAGNAVAGPSAGAGGWIEILGTETPTGGGQSTPALIRFKWVDGQIQDLTSEPIQQPTMATNVGHWIGFLYRYSNGLFFDAFKNEVHRDTAYQGNTVIPGEFSQSSTVGSLSSGNPHVLTIAGERAIASHVPDLDRLQFQIVGSDGKLYTIVRIPHASGDEKSDLQLQISTVN